MFSISISFLPIITSVIVINTSRTADHYFLVHIVHFRFVFMSNMHLVHDNHIYECFMNHSHKISFAFFLLWFIPVIYSDSFSIDSLLFYILAYIYIFYISIVWITVMPLTRRNVSPVALNRECLPPQVQRDELECVANRTITNLIRYRSYIHLRDVYSTLVDPSIHFHFIAYEILF